MLAVTLVSTIIIHLLPTFDTILPLKLKFIGMF